MEPDLFLLTAAVTPDHSIPASVADPLARAHQYRQAIFAWSAVAARAQARLIVVETTNAPRDVLISPEVVLPCEVEYRNFSPSSEAISRGKGSVEADAIDFAVDALADRTVTTTLTKVTGRLTLSNAEHVLTDMREGSARVRRSIDRSYCDTRLFQVALDVWERSLRGMGTEVDDPTGRHLEHVMGQRLIIAEYEHFTRVEAFATRPQFNGVSGTSGKSYGGTRRHLAAQVVGALEKRVLPGFKRKQL